MKMINSNISKIIKSFTKNYINILLYTGIFLIYLLPRIYDLGNDISNFDSQYWYPRIEIFTDNIRAQKFNEMYITYHPGTTLLWMSGFSNYFYRQYFNYKHGFDPQDVPHHFIDLQFFTIFPLVFIISLLGLYSFHLIRKIKGNYFAIAFSILLSVEPFFLGISKFLHITGLQTMLGFTALLCATYYIHKGKKLHLILSGILLGLAVSTKVTAVLFGIVVIAILLISKLRKTKSLFIDLIILGSASAITFFVVNPFMWIDPIGSLYKIYADGVVENGFGSTGAPQLINISYLFYIEYGVYRLTGYIIILTFIGLLFSIKNIKKIKSDPLLLMTLVYFVVYNLLLTIPNKLKDRYLVEIIPSFILLAVYGLMYIKERLNKHFFIYIVVLACISGWVGLNIYRYHPNYSFYISDFVGGPSFMYKNNLSLMNRGEYFANAAIYLNSLDKPESKSVFFGNDTLSLTFKEFFRGKTYSDAGATPDKTKINYIVVKSTTQRKEEINNFCKIIKNLGPKDPFGYIEIQIYKCENFYKEDLEKIKIQS